MTRPGLDWSTFSRTDSALVEVNQKFPERLEVKKHAICKAPNCVSQIYVAKLFCAEKEKYGDCIDVCCAAEEEALVGQQVLWNKSIACLLNGTDFLHKSSLPGRRIQR